MATVQAKLGVLILLVCAAAAAAPVPATEHDDDNGCYYVVYIQGAPAAAKNTSVLFTLLRTDGIILWERWGSAGSYIPYHWLRRYRMFRSRRFRKDPLNFFFYTADEPCEDPCHLKLKVEDPGLDHLLPLSVRIAAIDDDEEEYDDYDGPEFARVFSPVLPTNPLVPGEADMDICDDNGCRYVVTVLTSPAAAVDTSFVQFNVSNKAGQLLWSELKAVESKAGVLSSFRFTSETPGSRCQDPCHLKLKADHLDHHPGSGLLPLSVSIRAIETEGTTKKKKFARNFTPVVPKIDPMKPLVLDQADMDLCNIIHTK